MKYAEYWDIWEKRGGSLVTEIGGPDFRLEIPESAGTPEKAIGDGELNIVPLVGSVYPLYKVIRVENEKVSGHIVVMIPKNQQLEFIIKDSQQ